MHPGLSGYFRNLPVFESRYLTDTVEVEVEKTFRERWVEPVLHPVVEPFQPWVKTKLVLKEIPSRNVIKTSYGLFMHPALRQEIGGVVGLNSPNLS